MRKNTFLTVLTNKNFLKLWLIQVISLITANMLNFVLIDRIFGTTNSSIAISIFLGIYILPTIILGPFVGVLIDIVDKKKILFFSNFFQSFIVLLYLLIKNRIWPIYSIVLLYSLCDEFFNPCVGAILPSLFKKEELLAANSFFLLTTQGSLILGFGLGGIILRFFKFWFAFPLASILLFLVALLTRFTSEQVMRRKEKTTLVDLWTGWKKGYNFIKDEPRVFFPMIFLGGLQIILGMAVILFPSISKSILRISFADSPFVIIIPALLGAALGGLFIERKIEEYRKKVFITRGLFSFAGGVIIFSLIPPFFRYPFVLGSLLAIILGLSFVLIYVPLQTLIQEYTPFDIRGRVLGALTTVISLAGALPLLVAATLVDFLGIRLVLFLIGTVLGVLAIYIKKGAYGIVPANNRP